MYPKYCIVLLQKKNKLITKKNNKKNKWVCDILFGQYEQLLIKRLRQIQNRSSLL